MEACTAALKGAQPAWWPSKTRRSCAGRSNWHAERVQHTCAGLHDMDEYIQAQLVLADSLAC